MEYRFLFPALGLCLSSGLQAATPSDDQPVCSAATAIPAGYTGWTSGGALESATTPTGLPQAAAAVGQGSQVRLHPDGQVTYITLPKAAGEEASFGGLVGVEIARAGIYRVALGDFVWVDMVRDAQPVEPVQFGHGPDCTPIKKIVDFALERGAYTLEISGAQAKSVRLLLVRVTE